MFSGRAVEEFAADRRQRVIEREADRSIAWVRVSLWFRPQACV